jgi:hypothetical protein
LVGCGCSYSSIRERPRHAQKSCPITRTINRRGWRASAKTREVRAEQLRASLRVTVFGFLRRKGRQRRTWYRRWSTRRPWMTRSGSCTLVPLARWHSHLDGAVTQSETATIGGEAGELLDSGAPASVDCW